MPALAQSHVVFAAVRHDTVTLSASNTATMVFAVRNVTSDTASVVPQLDLPKGWTPLFDTPAQLRVAAHASDTWLAGVSAPSSVAAGTYVIRAALHDPRRTRIVVSDSVVVRVEQRRAIEVVISDAPGFVGARDHYQATFFLRNRGNVPTRLALSINSSAGSDAEIPAKTVDLAAGGKATVVATISAADVMRSTDDVIEFDASDAADNVSSSASARVLVVPRHASGMADAGGVPSEVALRAAGPHAGVSPFVLRGYGPLTPGSTTNVDFMVRTPVGEQSIFGERDEYRIDFSNKAYRLGLGDESRSFSPLTASGFPGFGGGVQTENHAVNTGFYIEQNRWSPVGAFESGAFVGTDTSALMSASTAVVGRNTGARVGGFTARTHLFSSTTLEVEAAASDSAQTTGTAQRVDLHGNYAPLSFDVGGLHAGTAFAGPGRGNDESHASITARPGGPISFQLNTSSEHTATEPGALFAFAQTITLNELDANLGDAVSLGYQVMTNHHVGEDDLLAVDQQGPQMRGHYRLGIFDFRGTMAYQRIEYGNGLTQPYVMYRMETFTDVRPNQSIGLYGEVSSGSSFDGLSGGGYLAGASTQLMLPLGVGLNFNGSANVPRYVGGPRSAEGDVSVSRQLRNGSVLMFREHFTRYEGGLVAPGMNALYVELRMPLHIRTAAAHSEGMVTGRVTDAASGRGLSNLLVRIGNESVITDSQGRVTVSGLAPGHYGVSLETSDRAASAGGGGGGVLVGDVSVDVRAGDMRPATFAVALAQSGRVLAGVREMAAATGEMGADPDSLVDAGALENAIVALEGVRDTVYRTTDANGRLDFGRVAPGTWNVRVMAAEIPEFHSLDVDHYQIVVKPGQANDVEFRVIPKHRAVHMMRPDGDGTVIRSTPDRKLAPSSAQQEK